MNAASASIIRKSKLTEVVEQSELTEGLGLNEVLGTDRRFGTDGCDLR